MTAAPDHKTETLDSTITVSAWLMYVVIVFEILFMVSPAALYYYSAYGLPLNLLTSSPYTSWLTQHILPHFTYHESALAALMIAVSWPLIVLGVLMFLWGFCQIYYAKFTGKAEVTTGLYRYIRHPQYTGLAIAGLGTMFFWSRFLVVIAYVTMLFLYVALAKNEEARCTATFGDAYRRYLANTGRFLPRNFVRWLPDVSLSGKQMVLGYVLTLFLVVAAGFGLKHHVVAQMTVLNSDRLTTIVVAPMPLQQAQSVMQLAGEAIDRTEPRLAYLVPGNWNIPELGIKAGYALTASDELSHPMLHGNVPSYDGSVFHVLVTTPIYRRGNDGSLAQLLAIKPLYRLDVDVATGIVTKTVDLDAGTWAGIPVPVY